MNTAAQSKHTLGPWREVKQSCRIDEWPPTWVIEIHAPSGIAFELVRECEDETDYTEHVANARLIAAAPAMLEALESIIESATDGRDIPEWLEERLVGAKAAIRLAKGEL